jgi:hypothetical protein
MITAAERVFPVRIRIGVPSGGLGQRYNQMMAGWTRIAAPGVGP